jgi:hypothetical protein
MPGGEEVLSERMLPSRVSARRWPGGVAGLALALALVACDTAAPPSGPPSQPVPALAGSVLAAGRSFDTLVRMDLPDLLPVDLPLPDEAGAVVDAVWDGDSAAAVAMLRLRDGTQQLYRIAQDAEPDPIGPLVRESIVGGSLEVSGDTALYVRCGVDDPSSASVLDLGSPTAYRFLVETCLATMSPDGSVVAYAPPDARSILTVPTGGSAEPTTLVRLADLTDLFGDAAADLTVFGPLVWSDSGLAFGVALEEGQAVVLVPEGGEPMLVTPKGLPPPVTFGRQRFLVGLAWNPDGSALAVSALTQNEAVLRTVDPSTGGASVLALDGEALAEPTWSPDGEVLVSQADQSWLFVGGDGSWVRRPPVGGLLPLDWAP